MEAIPITLIIALGAVFILVLVLAWALTSTVVEKRSPDRQRLRKLTAQQSGLEPLVKEENPLVKNEDAEIKYARRYVPKSPKELSRIRRRLMRAGYRKLPAVVVYVWLELSLPFVFGLTCLYFTGIAGLGLVFTGFAAVLGYLAPGLILARMIENRKKEL